MEIKIERLDIFLLLTRRNLPNQKEEEECFYRDAALWSALDTSRGVQKPEQQLREEMRACRFNIILH